MVHIFNDFQSEDSVRLGYDNAEVIMADSRLEIHCQKPTEDRLNFLMEYQKGKHLLRRLISISLSLFEWLKTCESRCFNFNLLLNTIEENSLSNIGFNC